MVLLISVIIIALLIIWFTRYEGYRSCRDCYGLYMPKNGMSVLNPFVWPYSGTQCIDDLYIINKDSGVDLGFKHPPLTHLNTPDHVELVN